MKTSSAADKVFLSGDFNAYTREDPLQRLYDAGYTDIGSDQLARGAHLPVRRHRRLARPRARQRRRDADVTGAHVWNLSSVESVALEYSRHNYNATDFYEPGPYRASDHDPLVVGVDLPIGPVPTTTSATVSPVRWLRDRPVVKVRVSSRSAPVTAGTVEVRESGLLLGRGTVRDGAVEVTLPRYVIPGRHTLRVRYLGTSETRASESSTQLTVTLP